MFICDPKDSEPLRHDLRLREQEQVVAAAGFGVRAGHIEAAERMGAHQGAGAFSVQIQVPDMEIAPCLFQVRTVV